MLHCLHLYSAESQILMDGLVLLKKVTDGSTPQFTEQVLSKVKKNANVLGPLLCSTEDIEVMFSAVSVLESKQFNCPLEGLQSNVFRSLRDKIRRELGR